MEMAQQFIAGCGSAAMVSPGNGRMEIAQQFIAECGSAAMVQSGKRTTENSPAIYCLVW